MWDQPFSTSSRGPPRTDEVGSPRLARGLDWLGSLLNAESECLRARRCLSCLNKLGPATIIRPAFLPSSFFSCIPLPPPPLTTSSLQDDRHSFACRSYPPQTYSCNCPFFRFLILLDSCFLNNFIINNQLLFSVLRRFNQTTSIKSHHAYLRSYRSFGRKLCSCRCCSEESTAIRQR